MGFINSWWKLQPRVVLLVSQMDGQKCQGDLLPSLDGAGIIVQMVHRLGAGLVGIALIVGTMKLKEKKC